MSAMSNPIDPRSFLHDGDDQPPTNVVPIHDPPPVAPLRDLQPMPHAPQAEKSILSLYLAWPETRAKLAHLTPEHFHLPAHAVLYQTMRGLHDAGKEVEAVALLQKLLDRGDLDRIGGPATLAELQTYAPTSTVLDSHLSILHAKAAARAAIQAARAMLADIEEQPEEAGEIIAATARRLEQVIPRATPDGIKSTAEILATNIEDDETMLVGPKRRFLGRGGSFVIAGPSGIGKSTLTAGFLLHAAAGRPWHGIEFRRPLKVLVVQAENDDGDLAEMLEGAIRALEGMSMDQIKHACANISWRRLSTATGEDFTRWLESAIIATGAELVHIDPLLAYVGDDISLQKVASHFFRNLLQPVLDRTGAMMTAVHHTGKTSTDSKARENWSESDFAYLGFGSSELTNWARAVAVLVPHGKDTGKYKFLIAKRGKRAGMIDATTREPTTSIILEHSGKGMGWTQAAPTDSDDTPAPRNSGARAKLTPSDILAQFSPSTATRKDVLISSLATRFDCSNKLAREKVENMILGGQIQIHETEKRPEGGHPIVWLIRP
jgi:hypothetical protein